MRMSPSLLFAATVALIAAPLAACTDTSSDGGVTLSEDSPPRCGDGIVDAAYGEECDDGNTIAGDGCSALCDHELSVTCGNGAVNASTGEQCDDGNTASGDGCSATCQVEPPRCGDGIVDANNGEECDDGNTIAGDGCSALCDFELS